MEYWATKIHKMIQHHVHTSITSTDHFKPTGCVNRNDRNDIN